MVFWSTRRDPSDVKEAKSGLMQLRAKECLRSCRKQEHILPFSLQIKCGPVNTLILAYLS